ncbi:MAG: hypothetical protein PHX79_08480 [Sphaerochaetaceae bacterium]|nr:hypothetical protein [Sphaerochaetaceae bacterium]
MDKETDMPRTKQIRPQIQYFSRRLMNKLASINEYPLTLLEAPSGFGKTTALRHFMDMRRQNGAAVYWHTFSAGRPGANWQDFCIVIGRIDAGCADQLRQAGPPDEDSLPQLAQIVSLLSCPIPTYLVLDDLTAWQNLPYGLFLWRKHERY